jgi:hypothetical protein
MRGKCGTAGQRAHALPMQEPGQERLGRADAPRPSQASRTRALTCLRPQGRGRDARLSTGRRATLASPQRCGSRRSSTCATKASTSAVESVRWPPATGAVHPSGTHAAESRPHFDRVRPHQRGASAHECTRSTRTRRCVVVEPDPVDEGRICRPSPTGVTRLEYRVVKEGWGSTRNYAPTAYAE